MSFDALTLSAVRDELEPRLVDARLQRLVFVDELSLAAECFAPGVGRTSVLLSADLEHCRVQRIRELPARGLERDSPFSLVVRKHVRNARIRAVRQPRLERVFELDCEQRDASGQQYRVLLIVEAMGRRSNLVLVDDQGVILDAARRAPPSRNARRPLLPHLPYAPPPPQERLYPEDIDAESLARDASGTLAQHLARRVAGLSPLAARELSFRATGAIDAAVTTVDWERATSATRELLNVEQTHQWQPTVALQDDAVLEYAPYVLTHLEAAGARVESVSSMSEAMDAYYLRPARRGDPLAGERKALLAPLDKAAHTVERRIAALAHQLEQSEQDRDRLRRAGDAILAHQLEIDADATELVVDGERIELDSELSASDNAQAYFARYRKTREAGERVPPLLEEARNEVAYLADLRTLVEVAGEMDAIRALRREVSAATGSRTQLVPKKAHKSAPYRRVPLADGWEALIGTSAEGNATVTFDIATGEDLWLHARGVPGAHVILRGAAPTDDVVERAAQLAAYYSASRSASASEVDVTQKRYVKKIPKGPPGLVRYTHERTVRVPPRAP